MADPASTLPDVGESEVVEVSKKILDDLIEATKEKAAKLQSLVIVPKTFEETERYAKYVRASQTCPRTKDGPWSEADIFIAIQTGLELGVPPMQAMSGIAIINGRPTLWGDLALAVVLRSGGVEDWYERPMKEALAKGEGYFKIKRAGRATPTEVYFSVKDAQTANLWGKQGPWTQYPGRMLQMRARAFALRDCFPDALKGIPITEEAKDYPLIDAVSKETERLPMRKSMGEAGAAAPATGGENPSPANSRPATPSAPAAPIVDRSTLREVRVEKVEEKKGPKKTYYVITCQPPTGAVFGASTFSSTLFAKAQELSGKYALVATKEVKQGEQTYINLTHIEPKPVEDEGPGEPPEEPGSNG